MMPKLKWKVCGYIVELDELSANYTYPICKQPASGTMKAFEYIEGFYNTTIIYSHCVYQSSNEYEKNYMLAKDNTIYTTFLTNSVI